MNVTVKVLIQIFQKMKIILHLLTKKTNMIHNHLVGYLQWDRKNWHQVRSKHNSKKIITSIIVKKIFSTDNPWAGWCMVTLRNSCYQSTPFTPSQDRTHNINPHYIPLPTHDSIAAEWIFQNISIEPRWTSQWSNLINNGEKYLVKEAMLERINSTLRMRHKSVKQLMSKEMKYFLIQKTISLLREDRKKGRST